MERRKRKRTQALRRGDGGGKDREEEEDKWRKERKERAEKGRLTFSLNSDTNIQVFSYDSLRQVSSRPKYRGCAFTKIYAIYSEFMRSTSTHHGLLDIPEGCVHILLYCLFVPILSSLPPSYFSLCLILPLFLLFFPIPSVSLVCPLLPYVTPPPLSLSLSFQTVMSTKATSKSRPYNVSIISNQTLCSTCNRKREPLEPEGGFQI